MTSRIHLSGSVSLSADLAVHRPQCAAYEAALGCIEASRTAACLIARHLPRSEWPGATTEDRARLWDLLAKRGLPGASSADLETLRGYTRWLRGGVGWEHGAAPPDADDAVVIDEADDGPAVGSQDRRVDVGPDGGSHARGRLLPLRPTPSVPPPDGLIEALETGLDQARALRDIRAAMEAAGIGPGPTVVCSDDDLKREP